MQCANPQSSCLLSICSYLCLYVNTTKSLLFNCVTKGRVCVCVYRVKPSPLLNSPSSHSHLPPSLFSQPTVVHSHFLLVFTTHCSPFSLSPPSLLVFTTHCSPFSLPPPSLLVFTTHCSPFSLPPPSLLVFTTHCIPFSLPPPLQYLLALVHHFLFLCHYWYGGLLQHSARGLLP